MRICMIVKNEMKCDARVYKEAKTLAKFGYEVIVLAMLDKDVKKRETIQGFQVLRTKFYLQFLPSSLFWLPFKYSEYFLKTLLISIRQKAEVYHAHDINTLLIAFISARINRAKFIYDSHELITETNQVKRRPLFYRKFIEVFEKCLAMRADAVIMTSKSRGEIFCQKYRLSFPTIIMNCAERGDQVKNKTLRNYIKISQEEKIILYQGALLPGRGLFTLINCLQYLKECVLVIMGPDFEGMKEKLKKVAQENNVKERVIFLPPVPPYELINVTAGADVGTCLIENISKSYYYEAPTKLFEYLMAGVPQVASNFPEIRNVIGHQGVGELVNPEDSAEVAKAIRRIIENEDLSGIKKKARELALKEYNWEKQGEKLVELYARLLQSN